VAQREVALERQSAAAQQRRRRGDDQRLRLQRQRLQLGVARAEVADVEVDAALAQRRRVVGRFGQQLQRGLRQPLLQRQQQRRAEDHGHALGQADDEVPRPLRHRRDRGRRGQRVGLGQQPRHRLAQPLRARRGHQAAAGAHQQRVAQRLAQPRQRMAGGRHAQVQALGRRGHAAAGQQRVQHAQQVEVVGFHGVQLSVLNIALVKR